jgi:hypothetical protein
MIGMYNHNCIHNELSEVGILFNRFRKYSVVSVLSGMLSLTSVSCMAEASPNSGIDGFKHWLTGSDSKTVQLLPGVGDDALTIINSNVVAHVKFNVTQYGEMSFAISASSLPNQEALRVDLSKSRFIKLTYKANQFVVLQLRQTGVHGGVQNHVVLPPAKKWVTRTIYFSDFNGGLKPLDLTDVAKFNFALLSNNEKDGYAELSVKSFRIDHFQPVSSE